MCLIQRLRREWISVSAFWFLWSHETDSWSFGGLRFALRCDTLKFGLNRTAFRFTYFGRLCLMILLLLFQQLTHVLMIFSLLASFSLLSLCPFQSSVEPIGIDSEGNLYYSFGFSDFRICKRIWGRLGETDVASCYSAIQTVCLALVTVAEIVCSLLEFPVDSF